MVFKFFFRHVVIDVECVNAFRCYVVFVFQNAQQKVLCANDPTLENFGFEVGDLEDFLGLFDEWDVSGPTWLGGTGPDRTLDELPQFLEVTIQPFQNANCGAFTFFDDAEEEVFHTDVVVPQTKGFFSAQGNDLAYPWRKFCVHVL